MASPDLAKCSTRCMGQHCGASRSHTNSRKQGRQPSTKSSLWSTKVARPVCRAPPGSAGLRRALPGPAGLSVADLKDWPFGTLDIDVLGSCIVVCGHVIRRRPYRVECTGSLPTSEVKRRRARLVLGWGTAREHLRVLSAFAPHPSARNPVGC